MTNEVKAYNWTDVPTNQPRAGITMRGFRGDKALVCYNVLTPEFTPGPHKHPFDQIFMIVQGRVNLHIEDQVFDCGPGTVIRIPPNAMHWAEAPLPENSPTINIDVFGPAREDYLHMVKYQADTFADGK
jgi:quercetin dioxygenase-like cupin family protein